MAKNEIVITNEYREKTKKALSKYFERLMIKQLVSVDEYCNISESSIDPTQLPIKAENASVQKLYELRKFLEKFSNIVHKVGGKKYLYNTNPFYKPYFMILEFFRSTNFKRKYFMGKKGCGKTMAVLLALNKLLEEDKKVTPLFLMFDRNKKEIYIKSLLEVVSKKGLGKKRTKFYQNLQDYIFENSNLLILDDIHYIFEEAIKNKEVLSKFLDVFEKLYEKSCEGKKVLLISETLLFSYAEKIKNKRLDEIIKKFGLYTTSKHNKEELLKDSKQNRIEFGNFSEFPYFSKQDYFTCLRFYGRFNISFQVGLILYNISSSPRALVKIIKLFKKYGNLQLSTLYEITHKKLINLQLQLKRLGGRNYEIKRLNNLIYLIENYPFFNGNYPTQKVYQFNSNSYINGMTKDTAKLLYEPYWLIWVDYMLETDSLEIMKYGGKIK